MTHDALALFYKYLDNLGHSEYKDCISPEDLIIKDLIEGSTKVSNESVSVSQSQSDNGTHISESTSGKGSKP